MSASLRLVKPEPADEQEFQAMMREWAHNDKRGMITVLKGFRGDFHLFLKSLEDHSAGIGLPEGHVPSTTYVLKDDSGRLYGIVSFRHRLTDMLRLFGGHIGYGIRPSERRKGFGTKQLRLALLKVIEFGLTKVLLTCDADNPASAGVIENNGGVLQWEGFYPPAGRSIRRYMITLAENNKEELS
ncbi:MAG: GNAT family N-acetyltransferase [Clostridiales bacterium]|nr:GNAT family N-acetyltransferase [Clostridiales bacterium]